MIRNWVMRLGLVLAIAGSTGFAPAVAETGWKGAYAGVNAGGTIPDDRDAKTVGTAGFLTLVPALAPSKLKTDANGFVGGAQIGYNFQNGNIVYGAEADIAYVDAKGSDSFTSSATVLGTTLTTSAEHKIDYLGTVRGRLGVTASDRLLVYGTAGLAYGRVKDNASVVANAAPSTLFWRGSSSSTKTGYTVGGGAEYALSDRTTIRAEYLYYDLGDTTTTALGSPGVRATAALNGIDYAEKSKANGSLLRVGLNFRF